MRRLQNWGRPQWKPQQQPASHQVKADLQDIVNKHQAAALLEANENIRALKEQREAHMDIVQNQENTIVKLEAQVKELQQSQSQQVNGDEVKAKSEACTSTGPTSTDSLQQEIQELKRQLQAKDELIEKLQQPQNSTTTPENATHVIPTIDDNEADQDDTNSEDNSTKTIQKLEAKVKLLTEKTTTQEQEIEKLQNVLKELEDFYAPNQSLEVEENDEEGVKSPHGGLEVVQEEPLDASETSEHKEEHNLHLDDKSIDSQSTEIQPTSIMTLNGNQLVLLISSMPGNRTVAQNQSRLETILQEYLNLSSPTNEVQILDGCEKDPASITLRNDLFRISGLHAVYPQLFLVNFATNDISFVGDFDIIMELHDTQTFADTIGLTLAS